VITSSHRGADATLSSKESCSSGETTEPQWLNLAGAPRIHLLQHARILEVPYISSRSGQALVETMNRNDEAVARCPVTTNA
jgi:hypothetical protein